VEVEGAEELVEPSRDMAEMEDASCESEDFEDVKTRRSSSIERRLRKDDFVDGLGDSGLMPSWRSLSSGISRDWLVSARETYGIGLLGEGAFEKAGSKGKVEVEKVRSDISADREFFLLGVWKS
jgi:hypothetical protein